MSRLQWTEEGAPVGTAIAVPVEGIKEYGKVWAAARIMLHDNAHDDCITWRRAADAEAMRIKAPFRCVLTDKQNRSATVFSLMLGPHVAP